MRVAIWSLILIVVFIPSVSALSFLDISPSVSTTTTNVDFRCAFTPNGTGSLVTNVTWYVYNNSAWSTFALGNQSFGVTNNTQSFTNFINDTQTLKNQDWICSLTLFNGTDTYTENSTNVTIENALPFVTNPVTTQTAYEDQAFVLAATATDYDNDGIIWSSSDLNFSFYGDSLFTISSGGSISFTETDEDLVGNHSMLLTPLDTSEAPPEGQSIVIIFELIAVNDAPVITTASNFSCDEDSSCTGSFSATDEEEDTLTWGTNDTRINLSTDGSFNWIPQFADVGLVVVLVNVTDGTNVSNGTFSFNITETNRAPNITGYDNTVGIQNQSGFFEVFINATDFNNDTLTFSVDSTSLCGSNPWDITTINSTGTNGSALINVTLNNSHVVCRNLTLSVGDGAVTTELQLNFSINNSNDAPQLFNFSYADGNLVYDIRNLSTGVGVVFTYQVNATDIDSETYEGEVLTYSVSGLNSSLFYINSSSGVLMSNGTINSTYFGNYSFNVTVTDDEGLSDIIGGNLTVVSNFAPVFITTTLANCQENSTCAANITIQDDLSSNMTLVSAALNYTPPTNNASFYNTTQTITFINLSYANFTGNETNWTYYFIPDDNKVGTYNFSITFRDSFGLTSTQFFTFNVTNINDTPYLGTTPASNIGDAITISPVVENNLFTLTLYGIDGDLTYNQDNLTFSFAYVSGTIAATNFTKTSNTTAQLSILADSDDDGFSQINLTVTDSFGLNTSRNITFEVFNQSNPPQFDFIQPFMTNGTLNQSLRTANASGVEYLNFSEGTNVTYNFNATDTESFNFTWYVNGTQVYADSYGTNNYTVNYGYFENRSYNVSVVLEDTLFSTNTYSWIVNVSDLNRAPIRINDLENLSVINAASISGTQTIQNFFRQATADDIVFLDPDDDVNSDNVLTGSETNTLEFSVNSSSDCASSYASFSFNNDDLTITPSATGTCTANFVATDGEYTIYSNDIRIDILELPSTQSSSGSSGGGTTTVTRTVSVPLEEESEVPEDFKLITPGLAQIYDQGNVIIPVTAKNEWTEPLEFITLTANISSGQDVDFEFTRSYIEYLGVGDSVDLNLTMFRYRVDAPFEINISAYIESLDYTDSATVYINALERGREDIESLRTRIGFARDLLNDNPECQELNEILDQAEENIAEANTLDIINGVINGCKYLVNQDQRPRSELPQSFLGTLGILEDGSVNLQFLGVSFVVLIMAAMLIAIVAQFRLKKI